MDYDDAAPGACSTLSAASDRAGTLLCKIIILGIAVVAAIHFVVFAYFLHRTAILSPISDMFAYIDDYLRFRAGETSLFGYLWQPHGEHHLLWIRLLTWLDVAVFHARGIPFIAVASVAVAATAVLIWTQLRRVEPRLGRATNLGLLVPMIVLGTANVTDCSVPINTTYPLTVFFVVATLVLFTDAGGPNALYRRGAAMLTAVGASVGTAAGLLAWPILAWIAWRERLNGRWLATIVVIGVGYSLFYMRGLDFLVLAPGIEKGEASFGSAAHLLKLCEYFLTFLGLPFTRDPAFAPVGMAVGGILLLAGTSVVLIATFSDRLNTRMARIATGMILFALGSGILATLGRGDLIDEVKVPVRYTMFVTALQVGLLCIILPLFVRHCETLRDRILRYSAGLFFAVVMLFLQVSIGRYAAQIADVISRDADCFAQGEQSGPVSTVVSKWPGDAERVLSLLRQQGLLEARARDCTSRL